MTRDSQRAGHPLHAEWLVLQRKQQAAFRARIAADPSRKAANLKHKEDRRKRNDTLEKRARAVSRAAAWAIRNPTKAFANLLAYNYGISYQQYSDMWDAQSGRCAICSRQLLSGKGTGSAHVDHDHATGVFRAILCMGCNIGIGKFSEDPGRLESAAAYLRKHGK